MINKKEKDFRLPGGDSGVGQLRQIVYKNGINQINKAMDAGFYIEAVMILDSIINDRLEARLLFLDSQYDKSPLVSTFSTKNAVDQVCEKEEVEEFEIIYEEIKSWVNERNVVAHAFVKYTKTNINKTAIQRLNHAKETANSGKKLMRKISNAVQKYNQY